MRNSVKWYAPAVLAFLGLTQGSAAQALPVAGVGDRVRLTLYGAGGDRITGSLADLARDSLTLAGEKAKDFRDYRVLPRSAVHQVEISLRKESQGARGLKVGALAGTLLGVGVAGVASVLTPSCDQAGTFELCHKITAGKLLAAIGLGAASGALLGYELASKHPRDVWGPARLGEARVAGRSWSKPLPVVGLGRAGGHGVLLLGVSFTR